MKTPINATATHHSTAYRSFIHSAPLLNLPAKLSSLFRCSQMRVPNTRHPRPPSLDSHSPCSRLLFINNLTLPRQNLKSLPNSHPLSCGQSRLDRRNGDWHVLVTEHRDRWDSSLWEGEALGVGSSSWFRVVEHFPEVGCSLIMVVMIYPYWRIWNPDLRPKRSKK